jgi:SAM-dependent methyltransferase
MNTDEQLKKIVKEKYGEIAKQDAAKDQGCCGSDCGCGEADYTVFSEDYKALAGYNPDADLGLGCGLPTEYADLRPGQIVVDLGSGAGNDCFVARHYVGEKGQVIGIDMTEEMIEKARSNTKKLNLDNVDFILGDIDNIPLKDNYADVVVSNCVLNLVPDKKKAFKEIYRILKPGGHFSIADIVVAGYMPPEFKKDAELYAGCVSGAIEKSEYLEIIEGIGFNNLLVHQEQEMVLPGSISERYKSGAEPGKELGKIISITLNAQK